MSKSYDEGRVQWFDFEEDESTDAIADKYVLTIADEDGEELATIVHRTTDGKYPLDGDEANRKRHNAQVIVDALNENIHGITHAEKLR